MKLSAILEPLVAAGVDAATILAAVKAWEGQQTDALERRRANDRERQDRRRHVKSRDVTVTVSSRERAARVEDKPLPTDIEPQKKEQKDALTREFDLFWAEYPNKVGKPKAFAAFIAARKRATFEVIVTGLRRYMAAKPADRAWLNPATFFNQDRWDDQPANVVPMARGSPRHVEDLIDHVIDRMGNFDADATTEVERYQTAPLRLPAN